MAELYASDTFFHLSLTGRVGLVVISGAMAVLSLWAAWAASRSQTLPVRPVIGIAIFCAFEWLAPQVHYLWYRQVIDGLPLQWVIDPWPRVLEAPWRVMGFQEPASLSAHSRGALGWALLLVALIAPWLGSGWRRKL